MEEEELNTIRDIIDTLVKCSEIKDVSARTECFCINYHKLKRRIEEFDKEIGDTFKIYYKVKGYKRRADIPNVEENPEFWKGWDELLDSLFKSEFLPSKGKKELGEAIGD